MHASRLSLFALVAVACGGGASIAPSSTEGGTRAAGGPNGVIEPPPDAGLDASADSDASAGGDAASDDDGPFPLGATWGPRAVHFRLRADAATHVELDVYAAPRGAD